MKKQGKLNKRVRKNEGITLIALVITIIVLLILVGGILSIIGGTDGIFGKTEKTVEQTNNSSIKEEVELAILEKKMYYYIEAEGQNFFEYMAKKLVNYRTASGAEIGFKRDGIITYIDKDKNSIFFKMDENGEIKLLGTVIAATEENLRIVGEPVWNGINATVTFETETEYEIQTSTDPSNELSWITGESGIVKSGETLYVRLYDGTNGGIYYAAITPKLTCQVTFNANAGVCDILSKNVIYNEDYGELPIPTRDNCDFVGWYTNKKVIEGTKIESSTTFNSTSDQILYAVWSHTHKASGNLVSGTSLGDNSTYSSSGGCYTVSNSYTGECGSMSFSLVTFGGYSFTRSGTCSICGKGKRSWHANLTRKCSLCGNQTTHGTLQDDYCNYCYRACYGTSSSLTESSFTPRNYTIYSGEYLGSCTNIVDKIKYSCSCGFISGILDQD